jgi:hypothetical protein
MPYRPPRKLEFAGSSATDSRLAQNDPGAMGTIGIMAGTMPPLPREEVLADDPLANEDPDHPRPDAPEPTIPYPPEIPVDSSSTEDALWPGATTAIPCLKPVDGAFCAALASGARSLRDLVWLVKEPFISDWEKAFEILRKHNSEVTFPKTVSEFRAHWTADHVRWLKKFVLVDLRNFREFGHLIIERLCRELADRGWLRELAELWDAELDEYWWMVLRGGEELWPDLFRDLDENLQESRWMRSERRSVLPPTVQALQLDWDQNIRPRAAIILRDLTRSH